MKTLNRIPFIAFLTTLALVFSACGGGAGEEGGTAGALSGTIQIDGSSTVYPVTEAVAEEFRAVAPKVRVTIGVSGTGGGFKKFARGETVISNASRPIKDSEAEACKANGIEFVELKVAFDGMAVVVNPENDWCEYLTVEELKKIWEPEAQGNIVNWSQVRDGFPDAPLALFGPGTASGTFDYFTEVIVGEAGKSRGDYMPSEDDHVLVQGVAGNKNALGFFGLAYYHENADKLKLVAVDAGNGPVLPSKETVMNGTYTPLSRPLYIYVNSAGLDRPEVVQFVEFYLQNAADLVGDVGYIPMTAEAYQAELEKFRQFVAQHGTAQ
ncbi:MAG: PstS family phosphate ABC transporter substrate-binding protein [Bacteroidetes bacterium]|nr:MAG: PstS family phosphate ABC transporter substrate-binding protein [Bacteroidota bacterium]